MPAVHWVQLVDPAAVLYEPAAQETHVVSLVAPLAELDVPAAHCVQAVAPDALHVPGEQVAHETELLAPV